MSDELKVTIQGIPSLLKELRAFSNDIANMGAFSQIAQEAAHKAASLAPIGTSKYDRHEGRLRKSVRPSTRKNVAVVRAGGGNVPYANAINFGVGPRKGKRGPHNITASLFMQRASEAMQPRAQQILQEYIDRRISERDLS